MQLPVDIKAVFDEATNIEEARQTPLSVSIYMDESSPGDVQALVRQAFASGSSCARVSTLYFPSFPVVVSAKADMAVLVAGLDENIGKYAADIRAAGIPVMIVTTLPELVFEIAQKTGYPLAREDIMNPIVRTQKKKVLSDGNVVSAEPIMLDSANEEIILRYMGEWIIETCKKKRLAFAISFKFIRRTLSLDSVNATSVQNAGIGLVVFIPGADMPIMTLNQAKMLLQIAAAYGQPMDTDRIKELVAVVGGAFLFRSVARQVIVFVPAFGWLVKAAIGYAGTQAMGRAAIEYFEGGGSIAGLAEVVDKVRLKVIEAAKSEMGNKAFSSASTFVSNQIKKK